MSSNYINDREFVPTDDVATDQTSGNNVRGSDNRSYTKQYSVRPDTVARYSDALRLYTSTDMTAKQICRQCGVSTKGFLAYMYRSHRDLLLARHGVQCPQQQADSVRLAAKRGQTPAARDKYRDAIAACDSEECIEMNISQIARAHGLAPASLANQLRQHYPDIAERRERERQRRGIADNRHRGPRPDCMAQYARAVEMLRTSNASIPEAAAAAEVSPEALSQHLLLNHRDLLDVRFKTREKAKGCKLKGHLTGNGKRHEPLASAQERYADAVRLYRDTAMTIKAIAAKLGLSAPALTLYLRTWCRDTPRMKTKGGTAVGNTEQHPASSEDHGGSGKSGSGEDHGSGGKPGGKR